MKKILNKKVLGYAALALVCVMLGSLITPTAQPSAAAETTLTPVASPYTAAIALVKDSIVVTRNSGSILVTVVALMVALGMRYVLFS